MHVFIPIIVLLILCLWTKNVYFSLILGTITAAFIYTDYNIYNTLLTTIEIFSEAVTSDFAILFYVALLGVFIYIMTKSGASRSLAVYMERKIKNKRHSQFLTIIIGILIFIDDYFNLLTVYTIMHPITDKYKMSREKLAYVMDATAAPICVLTPISSWAGLVSVSLPALSNINGFTLYVKTIPIDFYPILTLVFLFTITTMNIDFGYMKKLEEKAYKLSLAPSKGHNGKAIDLILPIIVSIISTILLMLYSGGFFKGESLVNAFMNCDALPSLIGGLVITLLVTLILYIPRKTLTTETLLDSITEGFKFISPSLLVLILAFAFRVACSSDYLNFTGFVADLILKSNISFTLLPMILFITCFLVTLCTGVSWAAIGLLIPLASILFNDQLSPLMVLSTAAIIAGGAAGDHIGPLSDTTMISATISEANFIDHIISQFQYGIIVVAYSAIGYLISGLTGIFWLGLLVGALLTLGTLFIIFIKERRY